MTRIVGLLLGAVLVAACRTTSGAAGGPQTDEHSLQRVEVPQSLKGTPLEEEAKACAASYRTSMSAANSARDWTGVLTVTTAAGVATTGLAAGMAGTVSGDAAKKNWSYVSIGALAVTTLATGLNLWVNAGENAREHRVTAAHQATRLFNAGYLMGCLDKTAWLKEQAKKKLSRAVEEKPAKSKAGYTKLLQSGKDWFEGKKGAEVGLLEELKGAAARAEREGDASAARDFEAISQDVELAKKEAEKPAPEAAFCRTTERTMKPIEQLRDEAHKELAQCLAPAIWAYGPLPSAQAPPSTGSGQTGK